MECPFCSSYLEEGLLISQSGVFWSKTKLALLYAARSDKSVSIPGGAHIPAHLCRNCEKITIDVRVRQKPQ